MKNSIHILITLIFVVFACSDESGMTDPIDPCANCEAEQRIEGTYAPEAITLEVPDWMPNPPRSQENPLTVQGVALGRKLFYDPILSRDSTISCSSCHKQELAFTDGKAFSTGIEGRQGNRSAMSLTNLVYNRNGFFWDGRSPSLEKQALDPIEDHREMDDSWENVEARLQEHNNYPKLFRAAFGIERREQLTRELVVDAIAQFERTIISGNSRYDRIIWGREGFPTDSEQRGIELFFIEDNQSVEHPGCSHCHFNPLFTDNNFKNNGLDSVASLQDFDDYGRGAVTGRPSDNGRFRVPTLRNVEVTGPYMHDGRFQTLEEVLDHYASGGHGVINEDTNILPFQLSEQDKADLIAFMKMLTDTTLLNDPAFSDPFK